MVSALMAHLLAERSGDGDRVALVGLNHDLAAVRTDDLAATDDLDVDQVTRLQACELLHCVDLLETIHDVTSERYRLLALILDQRSLNA